MIPRVAISSNMLECVTGVETITVETSLGIREAAVRGPEHNWFGGPSVTLAVMPCVICVTLSVHVFRPLIPLSLYLVSHCSQAPLCQMGHTITYDFLSFSSHIKADLI